jgi:hypothetical protein
MERVMDMNETQIKLLSKTLCAVERVMDMNERHIELCVPENPTGDLICAHLNNGSRVHDVADLRQYIYEHMEGKSGERWKKNETE